MEYRNIERGKTEVTITSMAEKLWEVSNYGKFGKFQLKDRGELKELLGGIADGSSYIKISQLSGTKKSILDHWRLDSTPSDQKKEDEKKMAIIDVILEEKPEEE